MSLAIDAPIAARHLAAMQQRRQATWAQGPHAVTGHALQADSVLLAP